MVSRFVHEIDPRSNSCYTFSGYVILHRVTNGDSAPADFENDLRNRYGLRNYVLRFRESTPRFIEAVLITRLPIGRVLFVQQQAVRP